MELGIRAHDLGKLSIEESAELIAGLGLSRVQLAPGKAVVGWTEVAEEGQTVLADEIAQTYRERGIEIAVLGCYIDPVHPDREERRKNLERFASYLELARSFGAPVVGTETGDPDRLGSGQAFDILLEGIGDLLKAAEREGVSIGIEPVAERHTLSTWERVEELLTRYPTPRLGLIYDPVNIFPVRKPVDMESEVRGFFERFGDRILAIHAKDLDYSGGEKEWRLPAGAGELPYGTLCRCIADYTPQAPLLLENTDPATAAAAVAYARSQWEEAFSRGATN